MAEVKLATSFLRDVYELPKEIQKETFAFLDKISQTHPSGIPSLHYEKMHRTSSGLSIYSARINDKYRVLLHEENSELHLLKIAIHEKLYDSVNKIDVLSIMNANELSLSSKDSSDLGKLFARISNKDLEKIGVKSSQLEFLRQINTEAEYQVMKHNKVLPEIVYDNLDLILADLNLKELVTDYRSRYKKAIALLLDNVIEPALKSPDLDDSIKGSVLDTKERLLSKESLEEIIFFYNDALASAEGRKIAETFKANGLHSFEDYEGEIIKIVRGV